MKKPARILAGGCMLLWAMLAFLAGRAHAAGAAAPAMPVFPNRSVIYISPPADYTGSLYVAVHPEENKSDPSAEPLLTDPLGRRLGKDPRTGKEYHEIPGSYYEYEGIEDLDTEEPGPVSSVVDINNPAEGEYTLTVTGTEAGRYDLEAEASDRDMNPSHAEVLNVNTKPGAVHEYVLVYSNKPGAKVVIKPKN